MYRHGGPIDNDSDPWPLNMHGDGRIDGQSVDDVYLLNDNAPQTCTNVTAMQSSLDDNDALNSVPNSRCNSPKSDTESCSTMSDWDTVSKYYNLPTFDKSKTSKSSQDGSVTSILSEYLTPMLDESIDTQYASISDISAYLEDDEPMGSYEWNKSHDFKMPNCSNSEVWDTEFKKPMENTTLSTTKNYDDTLLSTNPIFKKTDNINLIKNPLKDSPTSVSMAEPNMNNSDPINDPLAITRNEIMSDDSIRGQNPEIFYLFEKNRCSVIMNGVGVLAIIDSGAEVSLMSLSQLRSITKLNKDDTLLVKSLYTTTVKQIFQANSQPVNVLGAYSCDINIHGRLYPVSFHIIEGDWPITILGFEFLSKYHFVLEFATKILYSTLTEHDYLSLVSIRSECLHKTSEHNDITGISGQDNYGESSHSAVCASELQPLIKTHLYTYKPYKLIPHGPTNVVLSIPTLSRFVYRDDLVIVFMNEAITLKTPLTKASFINVDDELIVDSVITVDRCIKVCVTNNTNECIYWTQLQHVADIVNSTEHGLLGEPNNNTDGRLQVYVPIVQLYDPDTQSYTVLDDQDNVDTFNEACCLPECPLPIDFDLAGSDLNTEQREIMYKFLYARVDQFANSLTELGHCTAMSMPLRIRENAQLQQLRPYSEGYFQKKIISEKIDQLLASGRIVQVLDPVCVSPVHLVPQKGGHRLVADYRAINKCIIPAPVVTENLDILKMELLPNHASIFATLDLKSGYLQIPIQPESQEYTSIICSRGTYMFKYVNFGISSAPSLFVAVMNKVLKKHIGNKCLVYLDDILVFARDFDQLMDNLKTIFDCLRDVDLKMSPSKCVFGKHEVTFLGHTLNAKGISPTEDNVAKIRNCSVPTNQKQVRSVLGVFQFYRKMIEGFAVIAKPLSHLLCKDVPFIWSNDCQTAFDQLKDLLTSNPICGLPDYSIVDQRPFIIITDASYGSAGYHWMQTQLTPEGKLIDRTLGYGGISFTGSLLNHSINFKEMYSVLFALNKLKQYIYGCKKIIVFTDSSTVKLAYQSKSPNPRMLRMLIAISTYNVDIHHRMGSSNKIADYLSRIPHKEQVTMEQLNDYCGNQYFDGRKLSREEDTLLFNTLDIHDRMHTIDTLQNTITAPIVVKESNCTEQTQPSAFATVLASFSRRQLANKPTNNEEISLPNLIISIGEIIQAYKDDHEFKLRYDYLRHGVIPNDELLAARMLANISHFVVQNEVLYYILRDPTVVKSENNMLRALCVPLQFREQIIFNSHGNVLSGHLNVWTTFCNLRKKYYWSKLYADVQRIVSSCQICNEYRAGRPHARPLLRLTDTPTRMGQCYASDLLKLSFEVNGYKAILIIVDTFTKMVFLKALKSETAKEVSKAYFDILVLRFGLPYSVGVSTRIISDNGAAYIANLTKSLCDLVGIKCSFITPYSAQGEIAESYCRRVLGLLRTYCKGHARLWVKLLPYIEYTINASVNDSTGYAPITLAYGFVPRTAMDLVLNLPSNELTTSHAANYAHWLAKLNKIREIAVENIKANKIKAKIQYDKKIIDPDYKINDYVFLKLNSYDPEIESYKLAQRYIGPFQIVTLFPERLACYLRDLQTGHVLPRSIALFDLKKNKHYSLIDGTVGGPLLKCVARVNSEGQLVKCTEPLPFSIMQNPKKPSDISSETLDRLEGQLAQRLLNSNDPQYNGTAKTNASPGDIVECPNFDQDIARLFNESPSQRNTQPISTRDSDLTKSVASDRSLITNMGPVAMSDSHEISLEGDANVELSPNEIRNPNCEVNADNVNESSLVETSDSGSNTTQGDHTISTPYRLRDRDHIKIPIRYT